MGTKIVVRARETVIKVSKGNPTSSSSGDFTGPSGSTSGNLVSFANATGKRGEDSGIAKTEVVKTTGDQTLAGVKTFSSSPVVPKTPTADEHASSKKYTDDTAAGAVMDSDYDAKGKVLVGTGAGTWAAVAVGANDQVLTADSGEASGVKWAAAGGGGGDEALIWFMS